MKIQIIAVCNLMGQPLQVGETFEPKNAKEAQAAGYLISTGKAKDVTPVIAVDAVEDGTEDEDDSTAPTSTSAPPSAMKKK